MKSILFIIFLLTFLPQSDADVVEIAVIVHKDVDVQSVDKQRLLDIYTMNFQSWEDGNRIQIADFKGNTELRKQFYNFIEIDAKAVKRVWLRKQFSGKSIPPSTVRDEDQMIEMVLNSPGTIGYINATNVPEEAKVLILLQ